MMLLREGTCTSFCSGSGPPVPQPESGCGPDEAHGDSLGDLKDKHHTCKSLL